jgi:hypothetical protein
MSSAAKLGTQPKALLKLPKEMPSNIVIAFAFVNLNTANHKTRRVKE